MAPRRSSRGPYNVAGSSHPTGVASFLSDFNHFLPSFLLMSLFILLLFDCIYYTYFHMQVLSDIISVNRNYWHHRIHSHLDIMESVYILTILPLKISIMSIQLNVKIH